MDLNIYFLIPETKYQVVSVGHLNTPHNDRYLTICSIDPNAEINKNPILITNEKTSRIEYCPGLYTVDKIIINQSYDLSEIGTYKMLIKLGVKVDFLINQITKDGHIHLIKYLIKYFEKVNLNRYDLILCKISAYGHLDIIKYFLELKLESCKINKKILVESLSNNHIDVFEYLIKEYPLVSHSEAITIAAFNGYLPMLKYLINKCPLDNYIYNKIAHVTYNHLDCLKFLIKCGADPVQFFSLNSNSCAIIDDQNYKFNSKLIITDDQNYKFNSTSIINLAASVGNLSVIEFIIKYITITDHHEIIMKTIITAFKYGYLSIGKYLIAKLNNLNNINNDGFDNMFSIMSDAIKHGHCHILQYIIDECNYNCKTTIKNKTRTIMQIVTFRGHIGLLEYLGKNIIKINDTDYGQYIKEAVSGNHVPIIKYLFDAIPNIDKKIICRSAMIYGDYFMIKLMESYGLKTYFPENQFSNAIYDLDYLTIKYLLDSGYNPKRNIVRNIKCAITACQPLIIKYLINLVEDKDRYFNHAVKTCDLEIIKLMIKLTNVNNFSYILMIGSQRGKLHLIKFAINKGADINKIYKQGDLRKNYSRFAPAFASASASVEQYPSML